MSAADCPKSDDGRHTFEPVSLDTRGTHPVVIHGRCMDCGRAGTLSVLEGPITIIEWDEPEEQG